MVQPPFINIQEKTTGSDIVDLWRPSLQWPFYDKAKLVQVIKCQVVQLPKKIKDIYEFIIYDVCKNICMSKKDLKTFCKNNDYDVCADLFKV